MKFFEHVEQNDEARKGRTDAKTKNLVLKLEKMFRCVD